MHRFFWFFLYMIEMRNMDKEKKLRWAMDPRSQERQDLVNCQQIHNLSDKVSVTVSDDRDIDREPYQEIVPGQFLCNICGKKYKQIGSLIKHLSVNHQIIDAVTFRCDQCNVLFPTKEKLTRHKIRSSCAVAV